MGLDSGNLSSLLPRHHPILILTSSVPDPIQCEKMASPDPASLTASDMAAARSATPFSVDALNLLLNAESRDPVMRKRVLDIVKAEPLFQKTDRPYLSRKERLMRGLDMTRRLFEICDEHDLDYMEYLEALFYTDEHLGVYLHEVRRAVLRLDFDQEAEDGAQVAFFPVINSQGSDEQQAEWTNKCLNHEILGCYAQSALSSLSHQPPLMVFRT